MTDRQALIIAASIILAGMAVGITQPTSPAAVNGCVAHSIAPSTIPADGQVLALTCDSTGKLRVTTSF
jgi:hypothetical protein